MKTNLCPSQTELRDFESGSLSAERFDSIAEHFESCGECAARFEKLESRPDRVVEQLRERLPEEVVTDDSALNLLISRVAALQQTAADAAGETQGDAASRRRAKVVEWLPQALAPAQGADELGRLAGYRVLRVLGMGGMGVVLLAEDIGLKRLVALKVINPKVTSDSAQARFLREAQSNAAVRHDNVVTIFQVGEDRGVPFLAMELLEGISLEDRLKSEQKLSVNEALKIARETAQGLAAAHAKGLMHRDIKPNNIWLESRAEGRKLRTEGSQNREILVSGNESSDTGQTADLRNLNESSDFRSEVSRLRLQESRVKLLDFGLARAIDDDQELTQEGAIIGTPNYLSPEQAAGGAVDARTDLFSLGVVLYEMLSGRKPFAQATLMATLASISLDSPREMDASVPAEVAALVKRLLEKRAEDRFATTGEVIAAIDQVERVWSSRTRESSDRSLTTSAIAGTDRARLSGASLGDTEGTSLTDGKGVTTQSKDATQTSVLQPEALSAGHCVPSGTGRRVPPNRRTWIATAAAAAFVLIFGVIVTVKDKNGKTLLQYLVPDSSTVEVASDKEESAQSAEAGSAKPVSKNETSPSKVPAVAPPVVADHLPPMNPAALVQRPPKLVAKDGEAVESWTVLPIGVPKHSASALSSDGLLLATFGHDGVVRVWDVDKPSLRKALLGHEAGPCSPAGKPADRSNWGYVQTNSRCFGPLAWRPKTEANARWLATASRDGSVRVWDVAKGTTVWTDRRNADVINMLAWSPDGTRLAVGYDDGQVRTWEAADGKELKPLSLVEGPPFSLAWSPDSKLLAVNSAPFETAPNASVHVWDAVSGKQQRFESSRISGGGSWNVVGGHANGNGISAMKWSPDGKRFAYKGVDCLLIHETNDWLQTERLTSGLKDRHYVQDFDWSPDGASVLVSWNGQLVLHGLKSGEATAVPLEKGQSAERVIWAPGCTQVALWIIDGHFSGVAMLDTQSKTVRRLSGYILNEFMADSSRLLVGFEHYPAVLKFEADKVNSWSPAYQPSLNPSVLPIVWSPDGQWLTRSGSFWKLSANDGPKPTWALRESALVSWSPDSKRFLAATGGRGINLEFWSADDRQRLVSFEITSGFVTSAWSPNGSQLVVGGDPKGIIFVRNGMTGQVERQLKISDEWAATSVAWSRRGDRMAFHSASGFQVINANDGTPKFRLEGAPHPAGYYQTHWSPEDRHLIVVGGEELAVFAGDTGNYQTSFALRANTRAIHFLDADTALCGTQYGTVHRLELATGKQELVTKIAGSVIEISPNGQHLAVDRGGLSIHNLDGQLLTSFLTRGDPQQPLVIGANGHFWSNDLPQGPFWATKGSVPTTFVYIVQTASGQQTLSPVEFANRYGWQNDPSQVRLSLPANR